MHQENQMSNTDFSESDEDDDRAETGSSPAEQAPAVDEEMDEPSQAEFVGRALPRTTSGLPANNAGVLNQHQIGIRYAITANPDRESRSLPQAKHLRIKLPKALSELFAGAWLATSGEDVLLDFFARNDQVGREGHKDGDPWKWMKIKPSGEIAYGISRSYTKPVSAGMLIRDYDLGVFKILIPFEPDAATAVIGVQQSTRPVFG
jgi:hypothetical protein